MFSVTLSLNLFYAAHSEHFYLKFLLMKGDLMTFLMIPETFDLAPLLDRHGLRFEHPVNESGRFSAGRCDKIQSSVSH